MSSEPYSDGTDMEFVYELFEKMDKLYEVESEILEKDESGRTQLMQKCYRHKEVPGKIEIQTERVLGNVFGELYLDALVKNIISRSDIEDTLNFDKRDGYWDLAYWGLAASDHDLHLLAFGKHEDYLEEENVEITAECAVEVLEKTYDKALESVRKS